MSDEPLKDVDSSIAPWPGHYVVVNDTQLFVRATPTTSTTDGGADAEAALYVHGLGGSSVNWTDFADLLSPYLDGEALDLPGFGRSGPAADRDYSIGAFARIVIAYLEHRGRGPVHLFGNSMGGATAIQVAALRPDLVRTLTLVSPAVPDLRVRARSDVAMTALLVPGARQVVQKQMAKATPEERARSLTRLVYADPSRLPPHRLAEAIEDNKLREQLPWAIPAFVRSLRGLLINYASVGTHSAWRAMSAITAPTLVIWGDHDQLVDVAMAPRVARTIPDCRLLVLSGVGHVAQLEDPQAGARAVLALLQDTAAVGERSRREGASHG